MKRLSDVILSAVALAVFALPAAVIALLIVACEKHPVFFFQERVGRHQRLFQIIKFQTMVDQQPTRVGRVLRRTGLDELPQFMNVLKGDMSIVGPRALTCEDIKRLHWDDSYHAIRWSVKPGITGFAQLYGGQHKMTSWFWDRCYLRKNNLFRDLAVIALSFMMNMFGKTRVRKIIFQKNTLK